MAADAAIARHDRAAAISEGALENTSVTRRGHHPLDEDAKKRMARLVQLHHETHPRRLARMFGVTARYVWMLYAATPQHSMAPVKESIELISEDQ